ncbi:helix-turn-helix domain-containing protein [uncultured Brevundimonas sp.]|uniref:helix-turn-helix domain-containing protein n=1 Tax=uncultured Brevundimonas sp. TaxID=213418 RepID=UPI0030EBA90C|tara:strand:- start:8290 stop:9276 length:987 start_codon:yes stop_codon:yes gene_type:complete
MPDQFQFSSAGLTENEAFGKYVRLYSGGSDVSRGEGSFHARVRAWRMDNLLLFERNLSGVIHARSGRANTDGFDHIVITLVLAGQVVGGADSGFIEAEPGDIYLTDTLRPSRTAFHNAHVLTASVARTLVGVALGSHAGLHGRVLKAPENLVLADFMQSLARHGDLLRPEVLASLGRAFIDVLSSATLVDRPGGGEARRKDFVRRETVKRHILDNLGHPDLSVESISKATGISRSGLYRLFEMEGGIAGLILDRRLEAVRGALDRRAGTTLDGLATQFGFSNATAMGRSFTEAYGVSALTYRKAVAATAPGDSDDSQRRWESWLIEIT